LAAAYISVSTTMFDTLVADGRMPPPKRINSRKMWDRHDLDRAFDALPGGSTEISFAADDYARDIAELNRRIAAMPGPSERKRNVK
jgi:hypothetical protein